jgi:hypothetical protein
MRHQLHQHWPVIKKDIQDAYGVYSGGKALADAIKRMKGENVELAMLLECFACGFKMGVHLGNIHYNHFEHGAGHPAIACPNCQRTGGHYYNGIR